MTDVLVVGLGISGTSATESLARTGHTFHVYDDKKRADENIQSLNGFQGQLEETETLPDYEFIVTSPGIPDHHPLLAKAIQKGQTIWSELEWATQHFAAPIIAITGSNGKTTTSSLVHHLLANAGKASVLAGNVGQPLSDYILGPQPDFFVIEASSFQLHHIEAFHPNIAAILNISPDHLDYHGSFSAYANAKGQILRNMNREDIAFLGQGLAFPNQTQVIPVPKPNSPNLTLHDRTNIDANAFKLLGNHNLYNLQFACEIAHAAGLTSGQIQEGLATFNALPHRLQPLGEVEGRLWINDSKATNLDSAQVAVSAMKQPFVLIVGGSEKGLEIPEQPFHSPFLKAIIGYGEVGAKFLNKTNITGEYIGPFDQACERAHSIAGAGGVVLLSPACASFDQFENYMARGARFETLFSQKSGVKA